LKKKMGEKSEENHVSTSKSAIFTFKSLSSGRRARPSMPPVVAVAVSISYRRLPTSIEGKMGEKCGENHLSTSKSAMLTLESLHSGRRACPSMPRRRRRVVEPSAFRKKSARSSKIKARETLRQHRLLAFQFPNGDVQKTAVYARRGRGRVLLVDILLYSESIQGLYERNV
jgi:hypothetical protein